MSPEEKQTREELAACYRLAALHKFTDLIYTHITARVPGEDGHFLINPYGWRWEEITASSLVKIDVDGNKVDGSPHRVNPAGFTIHSAVHMARHDAVCVLHTHTVAGVAVSSIKEGLLPLNQWSAQFYDRIAFHDYEGIALDLAERERIVADLGDKFVMLLRNHGTLLLGRSVAEALKLALNLERSCKAQVAALGMGLTPVVLPHEVAEHTAKQYARAYDKDAETGRADPEWDAFLRQLDKVAPGYKD